MLGAEMGHYVLATTAEPGSALPAPPGAVPGAINGGFFEAKPDWPAQHPSIVIAVQDLGAAMERVRRAGGEVLGEPMDIPGVGPYVSFLDSEGNRISLLRPVPAQGR